MTDRIPELTLRKLARTFFTRGQEYGFHFEDHVAFVNILLDLAMQVDHPQMRVPDPGSLPLRGAHVHIRALETDDLQQFRAWLDEPDGRYFLLSRTTGETSGLDALLAEEHADVGWITTPEGEPVGAIVFLRHAKGQKAELRKIIGEPSLRGRGLGTEAARLWVGYGIHQLDLRKLYLFTLASNHRNIALNEQLGFRIEGILKEEVFIDGEPHDLLRMGLVTHQEGSPAQGAVLRDLDPGLGEVGG